MKTYHYSVTGKVQGVFYRDTTQKMAIKLGLTGWVQNLPDASVEIIATGQQDKLVEFERWLWQGSVNANVEAVLAREIDLKVFDDFKMVY